MRGGTIRPALGHSYILFTQIIYHLSDLVIHSPCKVALLLYTYYIYTFCVLGNIHKNCSPWNVYTHVSLSGVVKDKTDRLSPPPLFHPLSPKNINYVILRSDATARASVMNGCVLDKANRLTIIWQFHEKEMVATGPFMDCAEAKTRVVQVTAPRPRRPNTHYARHSTAFISVSVYSSSIGSPRR